MDIRTFSKLQAIEDKELLRLLLIHLLDRPWNPIGNGFEETGFGPDIDWNKDCYAKLPVNMQEKFKEAILNLSNINLEDFERLLKFCETNDKVLEGNLIGYLGSTNGDPLPFEIFGPLRFSFIFIDLFIVDDNTGEVTYSGADEWDTQTQADLFEQLEQIIEFHLNSIQVPLERYSIPTIPDHIMKQVFPPTGTLIAPQDAKVCIEGVVYPSVKEAAKHLCCSTEWIIKSLIINSKNFFYVE